MAPQTIDQEWSDLITELIKYHGETGEVKGFLAWPKAGKNSPQYLIIHENKGLQPHYKTLQKNG